MKSAIFLNPAFEKHITKLCFLRQDSPCTFWKLIESLIVQFQIWELPEAKNKSSELNTSRDPDLLPEVQELGRG